MRARRGVELVMVMRRCNDSSSPVPASLSSALHCSASLNPFFYNKKIFLSLFLAHQGLPLSLNRPRSLPRAFSDSPFAKCCWCPGLRSAMIFARLNARAEPGSLAHYRLPLLYTAPHIHTRMYVSSLCFISSRCVRQLLSV